MRGKKKNARKIRKSRVIIKLKYAVPAFSNSRHEENIHLNAHPQYAGYTNMTRKYHNKHRFTISILKYVLKY
jgi:hypothetical protein